MRTNFLSVTVLICVSLAALPARANYQTGDDLYRFCTSRVSFDHGVCLGYIEGAGDTGKAISCIPEGITAAQLQNVVVKYLGDHRDVLHEPADALVSRAIIQAWCPRKRVQ